MNSHRWLSILLLFFAFILILVLIVLKRSPSCLQTDKDICNMLKQLSSIQNESLFGTYTEETAETSNSTEWVMYDSQKEIKANMNEKEVLNAIFTKETVYVKDPTKDVWFSQQIDESKDFSYSLVFDPEQYLRALEKGLSKQEKIYKKGASTVCGGRMCIRYHLSPEPDQEYIEIDRKTSKLKVYSVLHQNIRKTFLIEYGRKRIVIPAKIKKAGKGENVFLESAKSIQEEPKGLDLEYVKQFEMQRQEAEDTSL